MLTTDATNTEVYGCLVYYNGDPERTVRHPEAVCTNTYSYSDRVSAQSAPPRARFGTNRTNLDAGVADSGVPHKNAGVVGTPADADTFCRRTKPDTAGGEPPDGPRASIEL